MGLDVLYNFNKVPIWSRIGVPLDAIKISAILRKSDDRGSVCLHIYESAGCPARTYEFALGDWSRLVLAKSPINGKAWDYPVGAT